MRDYRLATEGVTFRKLPKDRRLINLSALPPVQKQVLWRQIKRDCPGLADLLRDPNLRALATAFDGQVLIYEEDLAGESRIDGKD